MLLKQSQYYTLVKLKILPLNKIRVSQISVTPSHDEISSIFVMWYGSVQRFYLFFFLHQSRSDQYTQGRGQGWRPRGQLPPQRIKFVIKCMPLPLQYRYRPQQMPFHSRSIITVILKKIQLEFNKNLNRPILEKIYIKIQ